MGISGLLPLLKSIHKPCNLKKFAGLTIGVDAYGWLHRGTVACAIDLALGKSTSKFVEFAMHRVRMLIYFGVTPYLVFDGDYLPSKGATEDERAKRREESKRIGLQLYRAGKASQAQQELQKAVDVTPEMARQLIEELKRHNIAYVVAPYEADAQLAYLERVGIIHGIISEDSDLLVFGAKRLLTKLDQYGDCVEINRDDFSACRDVNLTGWSDVEFRRMAILSGCDYLTNVNKMGLKTSYRMVRKYKTIEKILQMMQFDSRYVIPGGYLQNFRKAEQTFIYQRVFCPIRKIVITATEPEDDTQLDGADYIGKAIDDQVAERLADGTLNPMTREPIVVDWAPLKNSTSPWLARRKAGPLTPSDPKKLNKPIQSFFNARRVPLSELDPNSFTLSPSQQRLQDQQSGIVSSSPIVTSANARSVSLSRSVSAQARSLNVVATPCPATSHPPKRQRLCGESETEESRQGVQQNTSDSSARSRFFSSKLTEPSPCRLGKPRDYRNGSAISIWSDDSVEGIIADLPGESRPFALQNSKCSGSSDGNTEVSPSERQVYVKVDEISQSSTSTISSTTSSSSIQPSCSTTSSRSLTNTSKNQTVGRYCAINGKTLPALIKNCSQDLVPESACKIPVKSRSVGTEECSPQQSTSTGFTSTQRRSKVLLAQRKISVLYQSQSLDSGLKKYANDRLSPFSKLPTESTLLKVAKSPDMKKTSSSIGSEDFLIPNSEDEADDARELDLEGCSKQKMNLGRFLYIG